eukprot:6526008-Lingulodinium_polyedra.AAC.1
MARRGGAAKMQDRLSASPPEVHAQLHEWFPQALSVIWHDDRFIQVLAEVDAIARARGPVESGCKAEAPIR